MLRFAFGVALGLMMAGGSAVLQAADDKDAKDKKSESSTKTIKATWGGMVGDEGDFMVKGEDGKEIKMSWGPNMAYYDASEPPKKKYIMGIRKIKKDTPVSVKYQVRGSTNDCLEIRLLPQPEKK
jgi:hypothetical protein